MPFYKTRSVVRDAEQWTGTDENAQMLQVKFGIEINFTWVWDEMKSPAAVACKIYVAANDEWLTLEVGE